MLIQPPGSVQGFTLYTRIDYSVCMKRQNLMIDQELLREAQQTLGKKTFSDTVNHSLREAIRIERIKEMFSLFGRIDWEGDLDQLRGRKADRKKS